EVLSVELVACIERLRANGVRVGLLSNFSADLRAMLAQQALLRRFDALAISAEIGVMKPDAAAYQAILAMLLMDAHTCVFIDDLPANVAAAQAAGLHGIVFEDNPSCLAALARLLGINPDVTPSPRGGGAVSRRPDAPLYPCGHVIYEYSPRLPGTRDRKSDAVRHGTYDIPDEYRHRRVPGAAPAPVDENTHPAEQDTYCAAHVPRSLGYSGQ